MKEVNSQSLVGFNAFCRVELILRSLFRIRVQKCNLLIYLFLTSYHKDPYKTTK